jgi:hypothetical protein
MGVAVWLCQNHMYIHPWTCVCAHPHPISCRSRLAGSDAAGSGSEFLLRAEFDIIPMPWDWPAEVNYHEARAFLNWKGTQDGKTYRMPTVSSPRTRTVTVALYRRRRALVHTRCDVLSFVGFFSLRVLVYPGGRVPHVPCRAQRLRPCHDGPRFRCVSPLSLPSPVWAARAITYHFPCPPRFLEC